MFCQSCGAKNVDDARFCNMCGASLAKAGETGGPIVDAADTLRSDGTPPPAAAPPPSRATGAFSDSMVGVSLAAIGVRSNKKTWFALAAVAVALVGAGALASYLAMGEGTDGHAEADDPFVIGSPLPNEGEVDAVSGGPVGTLPAGAEPPANEPSAMGSTRRPSGASMRAASSGMGTAAGASMGGSSSAGGAGSSSAGSSGAGSSSASGSGGSTSMSTGTGGTASMSSGSTSMGSSASMASAMGSTSMGSNAGSSMGGGSSAMTPVEDEIPPERDLQMELYSSRVRFLIQRYYGARAQTCFDRATRNNPNVSGTVVIAMTIGADGQVSRARVARNSTGNNVLGTCLASQVGSWRLSAPPNGPVDMQIPFSR